jgi:phage tail-like protein
VATTTSEVSAEDRARMTSGESMRGLVEGLVPPRRYVDQLPASLQEDEFCRRLVSAFDEVIAPVYWALDCWDSYLDPTLAPADFVEWLAVWVGVDIDETWDMDRRRQLIQDAVVLYRVRGTLNGLAAHIRLYSGIGPEMVDSGGTAWSQTAGSVMPGSPQPHLTVRLRVDDPAAVKQSTVRRIVASSRPAPVPFDVEILVGEAAVQVPVEGVGQAEAAADAPGAVALPGSESIELAPQAPPTEEELEQPSDGATDGDQPSS